MAHGRKAKAAKKSALNANPIQKRSRLHETFAACQLRYRPCRPVTPGNTRPIYDLVHVQALAQHWCKSEERSGSHPECWVGVRRTRLSIKTFSRDFLADASHPVPSLPYVSKVTSPQLALGS
jgi:hypothetical protein